MYKMNQHQQKRWSLDQVGLLYLPWTSNTSYFLLIFISSPRKTVFIRRVYLFEHTRQ